MENIEKLRENVLRSTNISNVVESFKPITMTCETLKASFMTMVNEATINSVSGMLNVHTSLTRHANVDSGAMHAADMLLENLNAVSFEAKIVLCFEQLGSGSIALNQSIIGKLDALAGMEINEAKQAIRSGFFGSATSTYPILNMLITEAAIKNEAENILESTDFRTYNPVTYYISENENVFVRFGSKIFAMNESQVAETKSPNEKFAYISNVLEHVKFNESSKTFVYEDTTIGKIEINSGVVTRTVNENVTEFGIDELGTKVMMVVESSNLLRNDKAAYRQVVDALLILNENVSNIAKANNVLVVENLKRNERFAMFNMKGSQYVAVIQSNYSPLILEHFTEPAQAVAFLKKRSGYDATSFVVEELAEIAKAVNESAVLADAQVEIIRSINAQVTSINESIVDARTEGNFAKVEALNEALVLANNLLLEQKNVLAGLLKNKK